MPNKYSSKKPLNKTTMSNLVILLLASALSMNLPALGQFSEDGPNLPPPTIPTPPPPPPTPPPVVTVTPTPPPTPVLTPTVPTRPFIPPIVVPTDVTQTATFPGFQPVLTDSGPATPAIKGIQQLAERFFPKVGPSKSSKIFVFPDADGEIVQYQRLSPGLVDLKEGEILASVRRPARVGHIETRFGTIAGLPNSDFIVKFDADTLRITNLDARGRKLRIFLDKGPFSQNKTHVSIKSGYELVIGSNKLTRSDMRPSDGIARRHFQVLDNGHLAISEISVGSIISASSLIANIRQNTTGSMERRIIGDMSKMAAVLNHINGTQGFTIEGNPRLAQTNSM